MWKPEGCRTWSEVFDDFHDLTEKVIERICGRPTLVDEKERYIHTAGFYLIRSGLADGDREADLTIATMATWLMANFMDEFPPIAVSVEGEKRDLNWIFFTHRDRLEEIYFSWPIKEEPSFKPFFSYAKSHNFAPKDLYARFPFINAETGMIRINNGAIDHLRNGLGLTEPSIEDALRVATSAQGFLLCWPDNLINRTRRDFLGIAEVNQDFTTALDAILGPRQADKVKSKGGRRPRIPEVLEAINLCFPEGIDGLTRKQVARGILAQTGQSWSDRTLGRAIEVRQNQRQN